MRRALTLLSIAPLLYACNGESEPSSATAIDATTEESVEIEVVSVSDVVQVPDPDISDVLIKLTLDTIDGRVAPRAVIVGDVPAKSCVSVSLNMGESSRSYSGIDAWDSECNDLDSALPLDDGFYRFLVPSHEINQQIDGRNLIFEGTYLGACVVLGGYFEDGRDYSDCAAIEIASDAFEL